MSDTIIIPLSKTGKYAGIYESIIDDCDKDLAGYNWSVTSNNKYARRGIRKNNKANNIYLHRIILERILDKKLADGEYCDHIDGNGFNNRRCNLRVATYAQNNRNQRLASHNTSGYKGVSWAKRERKWRSSITVNNKMCHLGYFNNKEDAYKAYCEAAIEYFGEYANFGRN